MLRIGCEPDRSLIGKRMQEAELSLQSWPTDVIAAPAADSHDDERLPLLLCWSVWFGVSAVLWALVLSPLLR